MGYHYRRSREPYEKLDDEWDSFEKHLDFVEQELGRRTYDPFASVDSAYDDNRELARYKLFLLPDSFSPISEKNLFDLPQVPNKIEVRASPKLMLEKSAYPDSYLIHSDGDSLNQEGTGYQAGRAAGKLISSFIRSKTPKDEVLDDSNLTPTGIQSPYERQRQYRLELIDRSKSLRAKSDEEHEQHLASHQQALLKLEELKASSNLRDTEKVIKLVEKKYPLSQFLRTDFSCLIDESNGVCVIEFNFPDCSNTRFLTGWNRSGFEKFASTTQQKKWVKQCLCSLLIRYAYLAATSLECPPFTHVAVNANQTWFDPATGQKRSGTVGSLYASVEVLRDMNLTKVDPEVAIRHLKGLVTPNFEVINPIRPIFTLLRDDTRLVQNRDVDSSLTEETNLAAMDWEDFEHLVAQILEWEFIKNGVEVRVTRASRDRGVDAILFDPDPLRGGKFVVQAKRYTRTVDVSAVRDLYGTVVNEGANRGILITTATFGPDSYEFVRDKPISLVDGPNLLVLLKKHGRQYRIDLSEARAQIPSRTNNEND